MKRLAVLAATMFGPAVHAAPPEAPPVPEVRSGPQMAPTLPQVPRPTLNGSDLKQGEAGRAEVILPTPPTRHHVRPTVKVEASQDRATSGLPARGANGGSGTQTPPAPPAAIPPTLPTPPVADKPAPPAPAPAECGPDGCASGHRSTWRRFTTFLFYHPSKIYFPMQPTPYHAPFHTMFLCEDKALCGNGGHGGCAGAGHNGTMMGQAPAGAAGMNGGSTATGTATTARPSLGSRLFGRSSGKVQPGWATAGETVPGYRLAHPETPLITGQQPPQPPIVGTSYKVPAGPR